MPAPLPQDKIDTLSDLIFRRRKIEAIRLYRELTGLGLKEAKEAVEALEAGLQREFPNKFTAPQGKGCFGAVAVLCMSAAGILYWIGRT